MKDGTPTPPMEPRQKQFLYVEGAILVFLILIVVGMFTGKCQTISGPQGVPGPTGEQGAAGPAGAKGEAIVTLGPAGNPGDTGAAGEQGERGSAGDAGAAGDQGVPGATGPAGVAGADGIMGEPGPQGEPGPTGIPGERGDQGLIGPMAYLNPPPASAAFPTIPIRLFHVPEGILLENANTLGTEPPNAIGRIVLDMQYASAIRMRFAHDLADTPIRIRTEYMTPTGWVRLIDDYGDKVGKWDPQASPWVAPPRWINSRAAVR
ncbi:hypothetical protein LCGC14_1952170, partial [marine sediment metagenome]